MIKKYLVDSHTNDEHGYELGFDAVTAVIDEDVVAKMKEVIKTTAGVTQIIVEIETFVIFDFGIRIDKSMIDKIDYCHLVVTEDDELLVLCIDANFEEIFVECGEDESGEPVEVDMFRNPISKLVLFDDDFTEKYLGADPVMGLGRSWNHGKL